MLSSVPFSDSFLKQVIGTQEYQYINASCFIGSADLNEHCRLWATEDPERNAHRNKLGKVASGRGNLIVGT